MLPCSSPCTAEKIMKPKMKFKWSSALIENRELKRPLCGWSTFVEKPFFMVEKVFANAMALPLMLPSRSMKNEFTIGGTFFSQCQSRAVKTEKRFVWVNTLMYRWMFYSKALRHAWRVEEPHRVGIWINIFPLERGWAFSWLSAREKARGVGTKEHSRGRSAVSCEKVDFLNVPPESDENCNRSRVRDERFHLSWLTEHSLARGRWMARGLRCF